MSDAIPNDRKASAYYRFVEPTLKTLAILVMIGAAVIGFLAYTGKIELL